VGSKPAPATVASTASTTTNAALADTMAVPVTSTSSVWLPAASSSLVKIAFEVAGRVGA